ncbi:recombinase family protein [Kitasatospora sp. NPDC089797]|uniref:recombinase family protein n=1 Tax=Kitasatospora sp. NPDC089797 TaxID=3155298 RepID=UPI003448B57D
MKSYVPYEYTLRDFAKSYPAQVQQNYRVRHIGGMPSNVPRSPGRVPVALYIASIKGDPGGVLAEQCRQYADAREWTVTGIFTDSAALIALSQRREWSNLSKALSNGAAQGVVTWTRSMVADSAEEWSRLTRLLSDRGLFLVAGALDTPGQLLYGGGPPTALYSSDGGR